MNTDHLQEGILVHHKSLDVGMQSAGSIPVIMCKRGGLSLCGIVVVAAMWLSNLNFSIIRLHM